MSTKAKLGKDWVKAQVMLQETGETFHLILAPGQTWRSVVAWIDGKMVTGRIELVPINNADPRGPDVTVQLRFPSLEAAAAAADTAATAAPVTPAPVAPRVETPAPELVAAPVAEAAPAAVAPAEDAPVTPENSDDTAVQEPAPSSEDPVIRPAGEGRRKRRG